MKSYIYATAALMGAVANGSVLRREAHREGPKAPSYSISYSIGTNAPSGQDKSPKAFGSSSVNDTLPCGATSSSTYTVVSGDTLTSIASASGAGVCDIAAANNITNINLINAGQILTIPVGCTSVDNSTCVPAPEPEATETCVPGLPSNYIVRSGDTLTAIAKSFNITLDSLIAANTQIANPDVIDVGDVINVPVCPSSQCDIVGTYSIVAGDLFVDLAKAHGSSVGQILALNPSVVPESIAVGQQIILPQGCKNVTTAVL
ncbi:Putative LysM domain-containing protein [Septoria linicola]|uniref:LysM domain-containing protein n=1 Tax=Septoria linicola TaxID=215465 RepID=A0A9Q9ENE4_9PEZI|nr:putative LysM domain-containing protein [Septoria linicola]USW57721.1 Putative LysM domain-containing protein [Septoria linicola]